MGEELLNEHFVTVLNDLLSLEKQLKDLTKKVTELEKQVSGGSGGNIKNIPNPAKKLSGGSPIKQTNDKIKTPLKPIMPSVAKKTISGKPITPSVSKKIISTKKPNKKIKK